MKARPRKKVLYLGRFQPFHKGHLEVIRFILSQQLDVVLGIGCPMDGRTFRNPFSFEERERMVAAALGEAGMTVCKVVSVDDINDSPRWVEHVRRTVGDYDWVFTNSETDVELFERAGDTVVGKGKMLVERGRFRGTKVRELMASGNPDWEGLVPPAVLRVLKELGAEERVRELWKGMGRKCPECGKAVERCPEGHELCFGCGWQCDGCDWDGV